MLNTVPRIIGVGDIVKVGDLGLKNAYNRRD